MREFCRRGPAGPVGGPVGGPVAAGPRRTRRRTRPDHATRTRRGTCDVRRCPRTSHAPTLAGMTTNPLDPRGWPAAELAHYSDLNLRLFAGDAVYGRRDNAIILGSTGPLAQLAARKALEAGG